MEGLDVNIEQPSHESRRKEPSPKSGISVEEVKLSIGNNVLVAQKQRLIGSSPYFASLLRFHADGNLDTVSMIPPENVPVGTFLTVLFSLCSVNSKPEISAANVWDIIVLAKYFQLDQLEEDCITALRNMLPTLGMDELCRFWRKGNACAVDKITALVLVWISLKMKSASKCQEFLDFTVEEIVSLMSDEGFLPVVEQDVCMAVSAWCEHDPENRKKPEVLSLVLREVMRDKFSEQYLRSLVCQCEKLENLPKRAVTSIHCESDNRQILKEVNCRNGVIAGDYVYGMEGSKSHDRKFYRIDWKTRERAELDRPVTTYEDDEEYSGNPAQYRLCLVRHTGINYVGCLISYWMKILHHRHVYQELNNTMALYDPVVEKWKYIPRLPLPRRDTVMIQCGTFLYVIGGMEIKPYRGGKGNAHHCYRLDLIRLTKGTLDDCPREWERIADLNAPRIEHGVKIHYGRVVVFGGKTGTMVDSGGKKFFENARWSEAYDTMLNVWTMFEAT